MAASQKELGKMRKKARKADDKENEEEERGPEWKMGFAGVGGGGENVIGAIAKEIPGVTYFFFNTDYQAMKACHSKKTFIKRILLGKATTNPNGKGAGGDPAIGLLAAQESEKEIEEALRGLDSLIIVVGFGGGTGTRCAAFISNIAKKMGIAVLIMVERSFNMEGKGREEKAIWEIRRILTSFQEENGTPAKPCCDAITVCNNDDLLTRDETGSLDILDFFQILNNETGEVLEALGDMILTSGDPNIDIKDFIKTIFEAGVASVGIGKGSGANRVTEAINGAFANILFGRHAKGPATRCLINIAGAPGRLPMREVMRVMEEIKTRVDDIEGNSIIFGTSRYSLKKGDAEVADHDQLRILVLLTGYKEVEGGEITNPIPIDEHHEGEIEASAQRVSPEVGVRARKLFDPPVGVATGDSKKSDGNGRGDDHTPLFLRKFPSDRK